MAYSKIITDEISILTLSEEIPPLLSKQYNAFIYYAAPFVLWVKSLEDTDSSLSMAIFKEDLNEAVDQFKINISRHVDKPALIKAATYCLCALLDESMMAIQAHKVGEWENVSLLKNFYQDSLGGEKFFNYLNEAITDTKESIVLIEFIYLILSLGYRGKYFQNKEGLDRIKLQLFEMLNEKLMPCSNKVRGIKEEKRMTTKKLIGFCLGITVINLLTLNLISYKTEKPLLEKLKKIEWSIMHFYEYPSSFTAYSSDYSRAHYPHHSRESA